MNRQDRVTSKVLLTDILTGQPTQVMVTQRAVRPDGKVRTITQKIPVPDASLMARLCAEARIGDTIEVTVITEWSKSGYITYLSDFCLLAAPSEETLTV
jgi:hypothetical protein